MTALSAELPGFSGDVRLTRADLEDQIRRPLTEFLGVLQDAMDRSGVRPGDLVAVASVGGGARIPLVTEMLSERFRVPVITTRHPELAGGRRRRVAGGDSTGGDGSDCRRAAGRTGAGFRRRRRAVHHVPGAGLVGGPRRAAAGAGRRLV